jgi:hypothetical protein
VKIPVIGLNYRFRLSVESGKVSKYVFRVFLKILHLKITETDLGTPGKKTKKRFRVSLCINFDHFFHKFSKKIPKIFISKRWQIFCDNGSTSEKSGQWNFQS